MKKWNAIVRSLTSAMLVAACSTSSGRVLDQLSRDDPADVDPDRAPER